MEGSRPAGVDVRAVVVVDDPDEVRALQLGQRKQRKKENKNKKERDTRRDRTGGLQEVCVPRSCDESPTDDFLWKHLHLHFSLPVCTFPLGPRVPASESDER